MRAPVEKLSRTRTRAPSVVSRSTRCEPMKPAPPVTSARSFTRRLYHRRLARPSVAGARQLGNRHGTVGRRPDEHRRASTRRLAASRRGRGPVHLGGLSDPRLGGGLSPHALAAPPPHP